MKVTWSDGNLQVSAGDEIEILRGLGERDSAQVSATKIHNKTRGTIFTSSIEGVLMTRMPHDFAPPIHGYAKNIEIHRNTIILELEEKAPPIISPRERKYAANVLPLLKKDVEEIEELRKLRHPLEQKEEERFQTWWHNVKTHLETVFGGDSSAIKEFQSIDFRPLWAPSSVESMNNLYQGGLTSTKALLSSRMSMVEQDKKGLEPIEDYIPSHVCEKLPQLVKRIIDEAYGCYVHGFYAASSIMLRKSLEAAIFIRLQMSGVENKLFDGDGNPFELKKRIEIARQEHFIPSSYCSDLRNVKWFGDAGAHSFKITLVRQDLPNVLNLMRLVLDAMFD